MGWIDKDARKARKDIRFKNPSEEARRRQLEEGIDSCDREIETRGQMHQHDQLRAAAEKKSQLEWELNKLVAPYYRDR